MLSRHAKKLVFRKVRAQPEIEYSEMAKVAQVYPPDSTPSKLPSHSTLYREIRRRGLSHRRCKKQPLLMRAHALKRIKFCKEYWHHNWRHHPIKFSDECSVQKGAGHTQEWAFQYDNERWSHRMITELTTSRRPAQMVWGCIWLDEEGGPREVNRLSWIVILMH
jgi:hypothetical protein